MLESCVPKTQDKPTALMLLQKAMKQYGIRRTVVADRLGSYGACMKDMGS